MAIPEGADMPKNVLIPRTVTHNDIKYTVTTIGKNAFAGHTSLGYISMYTITEIGDNAFADCANLKGICCLMPQAPSLGSNVFDGASSNLVLLSSAEYSKGYSTAYGWPPYVRNSDNHTEPIYLGKHYGWISFHEQRTVNSGMIDYFLYEDEAIFYMTFITQEAPLVELEIPSEVDGIPVTGICQTLNIGTSNVRKIIIADSVSIISESTGFGKNMESLEEVELECYLSFRGQTVLAPCRAFKT